MKKTLVAWVIYGMKFPTKLYGDYFINHEIRIPSLTIQEDSWKVGSGFLGRGSIGQSPQQQVGKN